MEFRLRVINLWHMEALFAILELIYQLLLQCLNRKSSLVGLIFLKTSLRTTQMEFMRGQITPQQCQSLLHKEYLELAQLLRLLQRLFRMLQYEPMQSVRFPRKNSSRLRQTPFKMALGRHFPWFLVLSNP